jgi:hypothetical protein
MNDFKKYVFPVIVTGLGLFMVINGKMTEQNGAYIIGSFSILLAGLISFVAALVQLSKTLRMAISIGMTLLIAYLTYADYMSIKVPIEFQAKKEKRYAHVIQRLKDIRTAQLAYKAKYQKYANNVDSLVFFVKTDSLPFVKAIGEVPDTMSLEDALKAGIVMRDTNYVLVMDTLFNDLKDERAHLFHADSFTVVPFTSGVRFKMEAGMVERSGIKVPVFMAMDAKPFDPRDPMQVGSMTDPKTNGNWE